MKIQSALSLTILAVAGLALLPNQSQAQFVAYHDFGEPAALPGNITVHTIAASGTTGDLNINPVELIQFSDGTPTGVSVTVAGPNGTDMRNGVLNAPAASDPADALFNGVGLGFGTGLIFEGGNNGSGATTFTLSGLDPNLRYDIAFLGGRTAATDDTERFTLSGVDGTPTNLSSTGVNDAFTTDQDTRDNPVPGEFVRWADINPGADGELVVTMDPEFGGNLVNIGYVSAMRLEATTNAPDTTPPTLSGTDPADDATGLPTSSPLTASFDETIALTGTGSITLRNQSGGADVVITLPGDVQVSGSDLIITPASALVAGEEYAVEISSDAVEDAAGNDYAGLLATDVPNWSFTTDGTAPMSTATGPMTGATGVVPGADLTIDFDEDVLGVGGKSITIHLASDDSVVDTIDAASVSISGGEVTIQPTVTLADGTEYYVNIEAGAFTDLSGNLFAGISDTVTWSFTTREAIGSGVYFHDFGEVTGTDLGNISIHTFGALESTGELNTDPVELVQFTDGTASGIFVTVAGANGTDLRTGVLAAPATSDPADALFNGVGLGFGTGLIFEGGNNGSGATTVTLTGLNPNGSYALALVGGRTTPADETDLFTLSGVEGNPTNISSTGIVDDFTTDQDTRGNPPPGDVVQWTDINPGADGEIVVTIDPEAGGNLTNIAYVAAMRLELVGALAPLVLDISESGGTLDFSWNGMANMQYDLVSTDDPESNPDPALWLPYNDGVTTYEDLRTNVLTGVLKPDPVRFFALVEEPIPPLLRVDFEADNGAFTFSATAGTDWAYGAPNSSSPGGIVNSGAGGSTNCWGTDIGDPGQYADPTTDSCLLSTIIDLSSVTGAELRFAQALDFPAGDTAVVNIIDVGTGNPIVAGAFPLTITDDNTSGSDWETAGPFALPVGGQIRVEWCFSGTGDTTDDYMGWYIDDVVVTETLP